jgi:5'(3')-deoxyribonucleotidase
MRLGIDLDGVVANFNAGWMNRYNNDYGAELTPDMVKTWDTFVALTHFETNQDFWRWARNDGGRGLFRDLPVFPEAIESLKRLSRNHDIVIITTKPHWADAETFAWIAECGIPTREVHITGHKWKVDCDVYLDDGPHNLESLIVERPDRTICRFIRPWNHPVDGVVDIDSWDSFEALVEKQFC